MICNMTLCWKVMEFSTLWVSNNYFPCFRPVFRLVMHHGKWSMHVSSVGRPATCFVPLFIFISWASSIATQWDINTHGESNCKTSLCWYVVCFLLIFFTPTHVVVCTLLLVAFDRFHKTVLWWHPHYQSPAPPPHILERFFFSCPYMYTRKAVCYVLGEGLKVRNVVRNQFAVISAIKCSVCRSHLLKTCHHECPQTCNKQCTC